MTPLEKVIARLPDAKKQADNQWQAKCPSHDDGVASLSISEGKDGRAILHCFAGCTFEELIAALGLESWELFPGNSGSYQVPGTSPRRQIVAEYDYVDADGNLLYQVVRYLPKDFRHRRPDGNGGWIHKKAMDGVDRVLYRLPELLRGIQAGETVYLVEGEKDADNLAALGLVATTNSGGAKDWEKRFALDLEKSRVVILPDHDAAGRERAKRLAADLAGATLSTRILELPNLPPKGDVSDWIAAGGTREELERLAEAVPPWQPPQTPGEQGYRQNFDISRIEKRLTDPPILFVTVQGQRVEMMYEDLLSFARFKRRVAQVTNIVPHMVNHQIHWDPYIHDCLQTKREDIEAPSEASEMEMIWHRVCHYLNGKGEEDETALADGRGPYKNELLIYFHMPTMHRFLSSRGVRVEPNRLASILAEHGAVACQKWARGSDGKGHNIRGWSVEKQTVADLLGQNDDSGSGDADSSSQNGKS